MFNEYKSEFTERPSTPDSIIKMWVLLEGSPSAVKLKADVSEAKDLDDFKCILKREFEELEKFRPQNIVLLDSNNTHIPPGTLLQPLAENTTDTKPLVVRYPISDSIIVVNFRFLRNTGECEIPHSSGTWDLLQKEVKDVFKNNASFLENANIIFSINNNSTGKAKLIKNEFHLMKLLKETKPNELNERVLNLKVEIEGKKAFGDWKFKEVASAIYNNAFDSPDSIQRLNMEEFSELNPSLSETEVKLLVDQLKDKAFVLNKSISTNEATVREYISIFMTSAVKHIRKHKDSTTTLKLEPELDGSRGYGNLDYEVDIQDVPILINEAKKQDMEKGIAQNLVQVYTAAEKLLGKRKRDNQENSNFLPPMMFGIVTMGNVWRFIRWTGTLQDPRVEITENICCNCYGDNYQEAKKVVSYIAQLLQAQADVLKNGDNQDEERENKRLKGE